MLVSVAHQSESAICIHMYPYLLPFEPPFHPPFPISLGHRKAPSWSPRATLLLPTSYFTFGSVCMLMLLSLRSSFPLRPMSSSSFSMSMSFDAMLLHKNFRQITVPLGILEWLRSNTLVSCISTWHHEELCGPTSVRNKKSLQKLFLKKPNNDLKSLYIILR